MLLSNVLQNCYRKKWHIFRRCTTVYRQYIRRRQCRLNIDSSQVVMLVLLMGN